MKPKSTRASLPTLLTTLTGLALLFQFSLFVINNKVNDLMDSLVQSSLAAQLFHPVVLLPILGFLLIQVVSYGLFITGIWFITTGTAEFFNLAKHKTYWLGILFWSIGVIALLTLNNHYFSNSFFATLFRENGFYHAMLNLIVMITCCALLLMASIVSYLNYFIYKRHLVIGGIFLSFIILSTSLSLYTKFFSQTKAITAANSEPNIIFIGLDSVRPDFTGFFGNKTMRTSHIDNFLQSSAVFSEAYTPLARTFPAWMSILTAKYPKHNHARTNLADPDLIDGEDTLAKRLQAAGYETIYGTDEKRFSNILNIYGFDRIMGPAMGVNDFLIGGLSDFPLTNLLINTPIGRYLFPYNYGNRAASITYEPKTFLQLVQIALSEKQKKPLFLAIHLCISHWPYTWANDQQGDNFTEGLRYQRSVNAVDQQLGSLLTILRNDGLLKHAIVVLLSDHGTTVGLPHDRIISLKQYSGDASRLKWLPLFSAETPKLTFKLHSVSKPNLETSYGQGTDVLSLKQYHVLLAIKGYGISIPGHIIQDRASLLDISPTILALLKLPPLKSVDGISFSNAILNKPYTPLANRELLIETGYRVPGIEEAKISVAKVIRQAIHVFEINPKTGLLFVNPTLEKGTDRLKERAVLQGNWLLARYPDETLKKLMADKDHPGTLKFENVNLPAYFVLANIKTGEWTIGLDAPLAKQAPTHELLQSLTQFYGDEI